MQRKTRSIFPASQTQNLCSSVPQLVEDGRRCGTAGQGTWGGGEGGCEATLDHSLLNAQAPVDQGCPKPSSQTGEPLWLEEPNQWLPMFLS